MEFIKKNSEFQIELHKYINENFLTDRILFIDPKENILEEFSLSDIQAVTSFEEGCPNVVLEALSTLSVPRFIGEKLLSVLSVKATGLSAKNTEEFMLFAE